MHGESAAYSCLVGTEWDRACLIVGVMQVIVSVIEFQYFTLV